MSFNYVQKEKELSASILRARDRKCLLSQINLFHISTHHFFKIYFAVIHPTVGLSIDPCNADRQEFPMNLSPLTITTFSVQIINIGLLGMTLFVL
jgi:hypothetical protein